MPPRSPEQRRHAAADRLTPEHRQHVAYEGLKAAMESVAGNTGLYGQRMQQQLARKGTEWLLAGGEEQAFDCVTLAARAAVVAGSHTPSDRMAQLVKAALRVMEMGAHPIQPVPDHLRNRDTAISGE
ncbi:hypothetical protein [Pyruvatibacter sp.]